MDDHRCTTQQSQDIIQQILYMKRVEHFSKYLGIPTEMGIAKSQVFDYIQDKILNKLKGWKEKHLFFCRQKHPHKSRRRRRTTLIYRLKENLNSLNIKTRSKYCFSTFNTNLWV
jgi:hypothetical protein